MADFDPDAFINAHGAGGGFDPDAFIAQHGPQPSVGQDVLNTLPGAAAMGPIEAAGTPQLTGSLVGRGMDWLQQHGVDLSRDTQAGPYLNLLRAASNLPSTQDIKGYVEGKTGKFYEPQTATGRIVGSGVTAATNPLSYVGGEGTLLKDAGKAALSGVGAGVGNEVAGTPGAIIGGLAAGTAPSLMTSSGRAASSAIPASRQASVDVLNQAGVFPRAGDVLNNDSLRFGETSLGALPGAGNAAKKSQEEIGRQFTSAVLKKGIGEDADLATPEVINRARDRIGDKLDEVAQKLPIYRDEKFGNDMGGIFEDLMKEGLPTDTVRRIDQQMKNVLRGFDPMRNGKSVMSGESYQALTRKDTPLAHAIDDDDPNVAYYATRIRSALDDAMERTATGRGTREGVGRRLALADLKEARRQWFNHILIGRAAAGAGEESRQGMITPARLQQVLTGGSPDRQLLYARGKGAGLQDLSRAGNQIMEKLPNSKSAERAATWAIPSTIVGSIAAGHPLAALSVFAPGLTGRALLSKPVQNYLINRNSGEFAARMRQSKAPAVRSLVTNPYLVGPPNPYAP